MAMTKLCHNVVVIGVVIFGSERCLVREYEYMMRVFMQHFISLLHQFLKLETSKISSAITFIHI